MQSYWVTQCIDDYIHIGPIPNNTPETQTFIGYHYKEIHWYEFESFYKHWIVMFLNYDTWRQAGIQAWHQMTQHRYHIQNRSALTISAATPEQETEELAISLSSATGQAVSVTFSWKFSTLMV